MFLRTKNIMNICRTEKEKIYIKYEMKKKKDTEEKREARTWK